MHFNILLGRSSSEASLYQSIQSYRMVHAKIAAGVRCLALVIAIRFFDQFRVLRPNLLNHVHSLRIELALKLFGVIHF